MSPKHCLSLLWFVWSKTIYLCRQILLLGVLAHLLGVMAQKTAILLRLWDFKVAVRLSLRMVEIWGQKYLLAQLLFLFHFGSFNLLRDPKNV
jgi:hypothetical protein